MFSCGTKRIQTFKNRRTGLTVHLGSGMQFERCSMTLGLLWRGLCMQWLIYLYICCGRNWTHLVCSSMSAWLPVASEIYWTHRLQETQPIVGLIYFLPQMLNSSSPTLRCWQLGNYGFVSVWYLLDEFSWKQRCQRHVSAPLALFQAWLVRRKVRLSLGT